jgi:hypothetical protein
MLGACFVAGLAFARVLRRDPGERRYGRADGGWDPEGRPEYWDEELP